MVVGDLDLVQEAVVDAVYKPLEDNFATLVDVRDLVVFGINFQVF
jgi:hypothetical protein